LLCTTLQSRIDGDERVKQRARCPSTHQSERQNHLLIHRISVLYSLQKIISEYYRLTAFDLDAALLGVVRVPLKIHGARQDQRQPEINEKPSPVAIRAQARGSRYAGVRRRTRYLCTVYRAMSNGGHQYLGPLDPRICWNRSKNVFWRKCIVYS
jgi:hypothetical protein